MTWIRCWLIALCAVFVASDRGLNCPVGEVDSCIHPCSDHCDRDTCTIPLTCVDTCLCPDNPTTLCIHQCSCPPGQKRDEDGTCIAANTCPLGCPEGEVEACINPCSELCDPLSCTAPDTCVHGCTCDDGDDSGFCIHQCSCPAGQKRDESGTCVDEDECPLSCPAGEIESCIDPCSELCDDEDCVPSEQCTKMCACPTGLKRDPNGSCVVESECPLLCPAGEVKSCIDPCSELCDQTSCTPSEECVNMCACPPGRRRTEEGICILEAACPCPSNEVYTCIEPCDELCDPRSCQPLSACIHKCACKVGYKRTTDGFCKRSMDCPALLRISPLKLNPKGLLIDL